MKLILKNFRQHKKINLEFSDPSLLMLKGRSGIGKTSVFDAIVWALYGEGDDISPWDSNASTEVSMEWLGFTISRTKSPATLTLIKDNTEYKDELAQEIINKTIGMSSNEFLACSYIQQGMQGSLLTLTPGDKLKFIQQLSIGLCDPERIKKTIDEIIKKEKTQIELIQQDLEIIHKNISDCQAKIESAQDELKDIQTESISEEHKTANENLKRTSAELTALYKHSVEIENILNSDIYAFLDSIPKMEEDHRVLETQIDKSVSDLQFELSSLHKALTEINIDTIKQTQINVRMKREYWAARKEVMDLAEEIYKIYPESRKYPKLNVYFDETISSLEAQADSLNTQRITKINEKDALNRAIKSQHCPSCNANLVIDGNGVICKSDHVIKNHNAKIIAMESEINTLTVAKSKLDKQINELIKLRDRAKLVTSKLPKDPLPLIKEEQALVALELENDSAADRVQRLTIKKAELTKELEMHLRRRADSEIKLNNALKKRQEYLNSGVKSKDLMMAEREVILKQLAVLNDNLGKFEALSQAYNAYLQVKSKRDVLSKTIEIHQEQKQKLINKIEALQKTLSRAIARAAGADKLRELNDFAAMAAVELIIDQINQSACEYLDKFFPDDGTQIILKNASITSKGDERAKISVEILHKGKTPKKINSLSGGEKSRACLAFQLAVSDLYKSPILLIDEGFTGLDEGTKLECMEILKTVARNKLVMVIEHNSSESMFDEVIEL
ncbi:MAG: SMC family ATPase [Thermoplasmatales archaeon]